MKQHLPPQRSHSLVPSAPCLRWFEAIGCYFIPFTPKRSSKPLKCAIFYQTLLSCFLNFSKVLHRDAKTLSDKLAYGLVRLARRIFDLVSRYKHVQIAPDEKMTVQQLRDAGYLLDDRQWLNVRFISPKKSILMFSSR